jgi:hypothetical protein
MAAVAFILSLVFTGIVASFLNVDAGTSHGDTPDYHLVPFAGDVWGA